MTVVLDGLSLTVDEVVRVARAGEPVELAADALERMRAARAVVERAVERGDRVYGLTTGVGVRKRVSVGAGELETFNRRLIRNHLTATGPDAPAEVVRATMLRLANGFALGAAGVRPELAERVVAALNSGDLPRVRMLGSIGQADLAPMADLAYGLLGDEAPAPKEGLALLDNNAFSTALAALAVADTRRLLLTLDVAGALDLEAFAANLSPLHVGAGGWAPGWAPYRELEEARARLRGLLAGSSLWEEGAARNLQDPLVFRCLAQVHGAGLDALRYTDGQLGIELNASQDNPVVLVDEDRLISVANFDILALAAALDFLRISLASVLTSANERMVKLLEQPLSGLPEGLAVERGLAEDSLAEFGVAGQALVAEARLLAQPVSFEVVSTSHAEGIEDRMTMAPLGARRLAEMVELGERIVAIELVVAAQAVELREGLRLGAGTGRAHALVRERIPFSGRDDPIPSDLEPLRAAIRGGLFAELSKSHTDTSWGLPL
jgi:histidine ammonia-lyase